MTFLGRAQVEGTCGETLSKCQRHQESLRQEPPCPQPRASGGVRSTGK
jgi:hypothetical protein